MNKEITENCTFILERAEASGSHRCRTECGFPHAQLRYIKAGNCRMRRPGGDLTAGEGEVLFIPRGLPYDLLWDGTPQIEFYVLKFTSRTVDGVRDPQAFRAPGLLAGFETLRDCGGEESCTALAAFYGILNEALRFLRVSGAASPVRPAVERIEKDPAAPFRVADLAALCNFSESRFFTLFKAETGCSPVEYRNRIRVERADFMLSEGFSVGEISDKLGFANPAFFRRTYKHLTGHSPRKRG